MRGWLALGTGAVLLAAAFAIEAPAALVDGRVAGLTDGRIRIPAASGSLWSGSGELTILPDVVRVPIRWRIEPIAMIRGGLAGSLTVADSGRTASFAVAQDDFSVRDFAIALPAAAVLRATGAPVALTPAGGTLTLDLAELARHGDRLQARADLYWKDAAFAAPTGLRIALGEVHLAAAGSGAEIPATLSNSGGELDLGGTLVFSARGMPRIDVRIRAREGVPADRRQAIDSLLSGIGRTDGAGGYRVVWPLSLG
jgi:hypothetical protein